MTTLDQVDALLQDSAAQPVLVFKHSLTCGTSAFALDELADHLEHSEGPHAHYAVVTVQTHREVSTAISTRLGIRHETPQALLIMDGRVVWSASHFRVTADAMAKAIRGAPNGSAWIALSQRSNRATTLATSRPSNSPSRQARRSSGATRSRSSPGRRRKSGLVGLPRAACAVVNVS